uniref:Uncharacterized protein n=1 Tax=Anguilla anguilla TaxID=7936 RepID=A0A0E9SWN9_ANGAN
MAPRWSCRKAYSPYVS